MSNIWILTGGGAKGCFQAGAIHHLATHRDTYRPDTICGTSVGAINSLLPAQSWEWPLHNIADLMEIWLGLETESDMYEQSEDGRRLEEADFAEALATLGILDVAGFGSAFLGSPYLPEPSEFEGHTISYFPARETSLGERILALASAIGPIFAMIAVPSPTMRIGYATSLGVDIVEGVAAALGLRSFYQLGPIAELIRERLDFAEFQANTACDLKLVSTSITDRRTVYMDRSGFLYRLDPGGIGHRGRPIGVTPTPLPTHTLADRERGVERIISGTLASAAVPVAFPPMLLNGRICFDGGVTDTSPERAVLPDVKNCLVRNEPVRTISIRCDPRDGSAGMTPYLRTDGVPRARPSDRFAAAGGGAEMVERSDLDDAGLFDFVPGLIGSMVKEVDRTDGAELRHVFGQDIDAGAIETISIAPTFNINSTAQIDPGLIRIQMSYGWMRAYDELNGRASSVLTDEIILARLHAWRLEELSDAPRRRRAFVPNAIPKIRQMKVFVHDRVQERIERFGRESLPRHQDGHFAFDDVWFNGFEIHRWSTTASPWDETQDLAGRAIPADTPPWR